MWFVVDLESISPKQRAICRSNRCTTSSIPPSPMFFDWNISSTRHHCVGLLWQEPFEKHGHNSGVCCKWYLSHMNGRTKSHRNNPIGFAVFAANQVSTLDAVLFGCSLWCCRLQVCVSMRSEVVRIIQSDANEFEVDKNTLRNVLAEPRSRSEYWVAELDQ